jgi:hypothetical protein
MKKSVIKILKEIDDLCKRLKNIRAKCPHSSYSEKFWADIDNYDKSDNKYYVDKTCLDCDHRWTEEQKSKYESINN